MLNAARNLLQKSTLLLLPIVLLTPTTACSQVRDISNELGTSVEEPTLKGESGIEAIPVTAKYKDPLANTVQAAIDSSARRTLSTDVHTPWQIMHALLGLRESFKMDKRGRKVKGLEWISDGPKFDGEDWFQVTEHGGRAHPYSKPYAFEGHANQSLAILSMLGLPAEHELKAGDETITIADMINNAKMEINDKEEVSWSLWALSRYLPPDSTWKNKDGDVWTIDRMAELQLNRLSKKPMMKHPCGGTHAMFALAHARNIRLQKKLPIRGIWLPVDQQIQKCIALAQAQQQSNGQFSTKFFEGKATEADFDKRIASSGHVLEFLMISLPQERLRELWVRRGLDATARDIMANRQSYVKCAPLYHAINGMTIYLERTQVQKTDDKKPDQIAAKPKAKSASMPGSGRAKIRLIPPAVRQLPPPAAERLNQLPQVVPAPTRPLTEEEKAQDSTIPKMNLTPPAK